MSTALWLYPWAYPPVFAWAFTPAAHLPLAVGYALNFLLTLAFVGFSLPTFFTGLLLILLFSIYLDWLPFIYRADITGTGISTRSPRASDCAKSSPASGSTP